MTSSNGSTFSSSSGSHCHSYSARSKKTHRTVPSLGPPTFVQQFANVQASGPSYVLFCEFRDLFNCDACFSPEQHNEWIEHQIHDHLKGKPPAVMVCLICEQPFRCNSNDSYGRIALYYQRMEHLESHMFDANQTLPFRTDFHMVDYLRAQGYQVEGIGIRPEISSNDMQPVADWLHPKDWEPPCREKQRYLASCEIVNENHHRKRGESCRFYGRRS